MHSNGVLVLPRQCQRVFVVGTDNLRKLAVYVRGRAQGGHTLQRRRNHYCCALVSLQPSPPAVPQTSLSIQNQLKSVWLHRNIKIHQQRKPKLSSTSGQAVHIESATIKAAKPMETA